MKAKNHILTLFLVLGLAQASGAATDDDESSMGFDSIVKDLTSSRSSIGHIDNDVDPFDLVKIHFGVGLVSSYLSYEAAVGPVSGVHQGFQATLGIDLFSKNWQAEGAVRSFAETEINKTRASLHEFDLKIIYSFDSHSSLAPFMGLGVAARYLDVIENEKNSKYTTPASILFLGSSFNLTENVALGGEISYRRPLIDETAERSAVDLALRLNTIF